MTHEQTLAAVRGSLNLAPTTADRHGTYPIRRKTDAQLDAMPAHLRRGYLGLELLAAVNDRDRASALDQLRGQA